MSSTSTFPVEPLLVVSFEEKYFNDTTVESGFTKDDMRHRLGNWLQPTCYWKMYSSEERILLNLCLLHCRWQPVLDLRSGSLRPTPTSDRRRTSTYRHLQQSLPALLHTMRRALPKPDVVLVSVFLPSGGVAAVVVSSHESNVLSYEPCSTSSTDHDHAGRRNSLLCSIVLWTLARTALSQPFEADRLTTSLFAVDAKARRGKTPQWNREF